MTSVETEFEYALGSAAAELESGQALAGIQHGRFLSSPGWLPAFCPEALRNVVSGFPQYQNSVASLPPLEQAKLQNIAQLIAHSFRPGCQPLLNVRLIGHADLDPVMEQRQPGFIMRISYERALLVKQALEKLINNPLISQRIAWDVRGAGASQLIVPKPSFEQERRRNRRVEIGLDKQGQEPTQPDYIRWVQNCCNKLLGTNLPLTGTLGPETRNAIASVQQRQGMPVTGILTPHTVASFATICTLPMLVRPVGPAVQMRARLTCASNPFFPGYRIDPRARRDPGLWVGGPGADNFQDDVRNTMDRLHLLWGMSNAEYNLEYPIAVHFQPSGGQIPHVGIPLTVAAISRNLNPILDPPVAQNFLNLTLKDKVGRGQVNNKADILALQVILRVLGFLLDTDFRAERPAVTSLTTATVPDASIPKTMDAITGFKDAAAGGRLGWMPIHSDEAEAGGDRFGGRTYNFSISGLCKFPGRKEEKDTFAISVFVPRGVKPDSSKVHVFFAAGAVTGESRNHVTFHGLRGASDASEWVLISIPGIDGGWRTIDLKTITDACLFNIGRSTSITALRLSGHSRGADGLKESWRRDFLKSAMGIDQIAILDAGGRQFEGISLAGAARSVIHYIVNTTDILGARSVRLNAECMRALAYLRFIQSAQVLNPRLSVPSQIASQLFLLPARGSLTAATTPPSDPSNLAKFCADHSSQIATIIRNEQAAELILPKLRDHKVIRPPIRMPTATELPVLNNSLKLFVEEIALHRVCRWMSALSWSHTFFVQEIAHEFTK